MLEHLWSAYDPDGMLYLMNDSVYSYYANIQGRRLPAASVIATRVPYQSGQVIRGVYIPHKVVTLSFAIKHDSAAQLEAYLDARESFLNPDKVPEDPTADDLFILRHVNLNGQVRHIRGVFISMEDILEGPVYADVIHQFVAYEPFSYDPTLHSESLGLPGGTGFSIPLTVPISLAATTIDGRIYINNAGDAKTWPIIRITGPCDNPTIENETTAQTMAITQAQDAGDYIEVDMEAATVKWYDSSTVTLFNIITGISATSEFWALAKGNNTIHIIAAGAAGGTITVSYYLRYASI